MNPGASSMAASLLLSTDVDQCRVSEMVNSSASERRDSNHHHHVSPCLAYSEGPSQKKTHSSLSITLSLKKHFQKSLHY